MLILADWIKSRVFGRDIAIYSQGDEGASAASTLRGSRAGSPYSAEWGERFAVAAAAGEGWVTRVARRRSSSSALC